MIGTACTNRRNWPKEIQGVKTGETDDTRREHIQDSGCGRVHRVEG